MSFRIIKAGILDTIQDLGRYGYQHLGINPGGAMDGFAAQLANGLLGKKLNSPLLEIHFPAPEILFEKRTIICITGADFTPTIEGSEIPLNQPVAVNKKCQLSFKKIRSGSRCYVSILHDLKINKWLNSFSTNLKAAAGGWNGRTLQEHDRILYADKLGLPGHMKKRNFVLLPWRAAGLQETVVTEVEFIIGNEWKLLTDEAKGIFQNSTFKVSHVADRMGYRLSGQKLELQDQKDLISSAVSFGTIQLPPDKLPIILMADHQTTGGYPRIAHIISAHLPAVAQMQPNAEIKFKMTDLKTAEQKLMKQQGHLQQVQSAAKFNMENYFAACQT